MNKIVKKKKRVKKQNPFTTIQLLKKDRDKLFSLAMDIKEINGHKEPPCPFEMTHYAIDALANEVEFFKKSGELTQEKVSPKTLH